MSATPRSGVRRRPVIDDCQQSPQNFLLLSGYGVRMSHGERSSRISEELKSAFAANIFDSEAEDDLREVIEEYYLPSSHVLEPDHSDDDSSESEELRQPEAELIESETKETDESDYEDGNFVEDFGVPTLDLSSSTDVYIVDDEDRRTVEAFDCCSGKIKVSDADKKQPSKRGCICQFSVEEIVQRRWDLREYTEAQKDLILIGALASSPKYSSERTVRRPVQQRRLPKTFYSVDSKMVCRMAFKHLYNISQNKLSAIQKHYREKGLSLRTKKAGGRKSNILAISAEDTERVVKFLKSFAEDHALALPGRIPGFKRSNIKLMPSSFTKASIYRRYQDASMSCPEGTRVVGKSTFFRLWKQYVPHIVVARPMTDLCWQCQKNNIKIQRSANLPHDGRTQAVQDQMDHLQTVKEERDMYNSMVRFSKVIVIASSISQLGCHPPKSMQKSMHYSFDFAQQVHLPSTPMQVGPLYFLVPRKCGIFGICCEALPQQINYLIDEDMSVSKGSNMVISLLHHFFENFGLGETEVDLHCDNCSGQNKNKFVMWYLAWRVMIKHHTTIRIHFMPPGHTKFAPDWCFGLLKRKFKRSEVHCLEDLCQVVDGSTLKGVNRAQIVGTEDGKIHVPIFDWQAFFSPCFRPLKGIKSLQHFRFEEDHPGRIFFRKKLGDAEEQFNLTSNVREALSKLACMPPQLPPPGISEARSRYLRDHIRQFVRADAQDILCP